MLFNLTTPVWKVLGIPNDDVKNGIGLFAIRGWEKEGESRGLKQGGETLVRFLRLVKLVGTRP